MLGEIGYDHLGLDAIENPRKPTEHIFFYRRYTTPPDYGSFPFVLEVALLQTESLRTITVGINHSPTYRDPFYNKPLVPVDVEEPVQSLDQVLNFYGLDTKASLRVHIISPNIKFENYGKSAISDEPYRDQLMQLIHEVALEYIDATIISTADYLRKPTMAILPSVIHNLGEIFSSQQLVSSLKRHLRQIDDETIRMALKEPDVNSSLRSIIDELDKQQNIQGLTRRQIGRVALPRHPYVVHISLGDRQFTEIINKSRVRAILIANSSELEELLVSFQFPVHYDIAILRAERNIVAAVEVLLKQLIRLSTRTALDTTILSIPLWLVHDASLDGINLVEQVLEVADRYKIAQSSIIDLGLNADDTIIVPEMIEHSFQHQSTDRYEFASHLSPNDFTFYITRQQYVQIQSLTPFELTDWFERSLKANSITPKFMPDEDTLYRYSSEQFRKLLKVAITKIIVEAYSLKHIFEEMIDDWQAYFPDWKTELFEIVSQSLLTDPQAFWVTKADRAIREMFDEFVTQDRLEYIRTKWLGKRK